MHRIHTQYIKTSSDLITPVQAYLNIRKQFPISVLLEAADYHGRENHFSFIAFDPLLTIELKHNSLRFVLPGSIETVSPDKGPDSFLSSFQNILNQLSYDPQIPEICQPNFIGYSQYDMIEYIEDISLTNSSRFNTHTFPLLSFQLFKYVIIFDHFYNQLYITYHTLEDIQDRKAMSLPEIIDLIKRPVLDNFPFQLAGAETGDLKPSEFISLVEKAKYHVHRGDVFQLVLSNGYQQPFSGDDFQVYRTLRNLNPSPYMFYFDLGDFHLLGSSPESQIKINNQTAIIHPIAGTFPRTGNDITDRETAKALLKDEKEMAEHVMLVDLARNDLSKHCTNVRLEFFHEIQYYSHVIHLVSEVRGDLIDPKNAIRVLFDTFPPGTLTGAPKYRAMELIDAYEPARRLFYGGSVGIIGLNGNSNLAIFIRSALSYHNMLYYQAGAGIVADSNPENEAREIVVKSNSIRRAIVDTVARNLNNGG
ncbi:MAG: anthranilate synthase component I family protein [Calditrichia bacterium]